MQLVRWTAGLHAKTLMLRNSIMDHLGTAEKIIAERGNVSIHWRKPLSIEEINRMAPTKEVRARAGRP